MYLNIFSAVVDIQSEIAVSAQQRKLEKGMIQATKVRCCRSLGLISTCFFRDKILCRDINKVEHKVFIFLRQLANYISFSNWGSLGQKYQALGSFIGLFAFLRINIFDKIVLDLIKVNGSGGN